MADEHLENIRFSDFLKYTEEANYSDLAKVKGTKVKDKAEFEKMREYILKLYEDISVDNSYIDKGGVIWDCMPIEEQPAVKKGGAKLVNPPDSINEFFDAQKSKKSDESILPRYDENDLDKYGNKRQCNDGFIPFHRVTLEILAKFNTLNDFFRKSPVDGEAKYELFDNINNHRHAVASQIVNNAGGGCNLNPWKPLINIGDGQVFSLGQFWILGGSGDSLQTVECGWHVYPQLYGGDTNCRLFTFWTPNNYNVNGPGGYNLTGNSFVQLNKTYTPGGLLTPSVYGSTNPQDTVSYLLIQSAGWFLYVQGKCIGYYPLGLFNNGQLATQANRIDFGGETCSTSPTGSFPPMGSGDFPRNFVPNKVAFLNVPLYYQYLSQYDVPTQIYSRPQAQPTSPACYNISVVDGSPNYDTIFFGGPGGNGCS